MFHKQEVKYLARSHTRYNTKLESTFAKKQVIKKKWLWWPPKLRIKSADSSLAIYWSDKTHDAIWLANVVGRNCIGSCHYGANQTPAVGLSPHYRSNENNAYRRYGNHSKPTTITSNDQSGGKNGGLPTATKWKLVNELKRTLESRKTFQNWFNLLIHTK